MMGLVELEAMADLGMSWDTPPLHSLAWTSKDMWVGEACHHCSAFLPFILSRCLGTSPSPVSTQSHLTSFKSLVNKHPLPSLWVCLAPPWFLGLPCLPGRLLDSTMCVILTVPSLSSYHPTSLEWLV